MPAARSWIRIYTELLDDPRIQTLPGELFKLMVDLWLLAGRNDGCCGTVEEIAWALHSTDKAISTLLDTLISKTPKPLFVRDDIGRYFPRTWDRRQFTNDVSNQRVKAFRERKKQTVTQAVTETVPEEADVTPRARAQSRVETETDNRAEQKHGRGSNGSGTVAHGEKKTAPAQTSMIVRDNELEDQLDGLQRAYRAGGVPFNVRDETQGVQAFIEKPVAIRWSICNYVLWAFQHQWPTPAKTKRFSRLVEDGDGEHGPPVRKLPSVNGVSKGTRAQDELERRYREREGS